MGRLRYLVPYAASAALLVSLSTGIVVLSIKDIPLAERISPTARSGVPARPGTELSKTGRLAWWRAEPEGGTQLWVANLDGTLRRVVAQIDDFRRVSKTRWTPDGNAVAYLDSGARLVVVRLDGRKSEIRLADQLVADSRRLVDQRWSKSGTKVAATVQRTADGRSDIWIAKAGGDAWVRATQLDDAVAGEWIDDDELLLNTTGGVVGVLRDGSHQIRPISGLLAGAPFIGDEGRVWFLAGRVSGGGVDSDPMTLVTDATLWSAYVDGSEPKRELRVGGTDGLRLDGRLPDGRLLVHRGSSAGQALFGTEVVGLSNAAGLIERVTIAQDKKSALGFTTTRIVRLDLSKPGTITTTVLLDSVGDADAWIPRTTQAVRPPATPIAAKRPAARYTYSFGGNLWSMDTDGNTTLLRAGTTNVNTLRRVSLPLPAWSPKGDRMLTTEFAPGPQSLTFGVVTIDRSGQVTRLPGFGTGQGQIVRGVAQVWSPDGGTIALVISQAATQAPGANTPEDLHVRFAAPEASLPAVPGREVAWSKSGLFVLSNGTLDETLRIRSGQAIEVVSGTQRTPLVSVDALHADSRAQLPTTGVTSRGALQLAASPDGSYVSLGIASATNALNRFSYVFVRVADARLTFLPTDGFGDFAWSPTRAAVGYTANESRQQETQTVRVQVATLVDAVSGETITKQDGRFAGWSPDGAGFYVARDTGLFWFAIGTAESVRIGPVGVPVAATAP